MKYCNAIASRAGERNSFDGVPGDAGDPPAHRPGISHVINPPVLGRAASLSHAALILSPSLSPRIRRSQFYRSRSLATAPLMRSGSVGGGRVRRMRYYVLEIRQVWAERDALEPAPR
ncbi:hypothetical protein EVAR_98145_1 [Eumeta japonica]|uniref:Uncharacterized protein n=1 Tax=Eumeta variegata TaxID=151549 RepID=A0A4C1XSL2_EUMVA|nr:hypothetical protein EVAR_98145_1 [Eumeta japonica]